MIFPLCTTTAPTSGLGAVLPAPWRARSKQRWIKSSCVKFCDLLKRRVVTFANIMTLAEFADEAHRMLLPVCEDAREVENILSIVYEDVLHLKKEQVQAQQRDELTQDDCTKLQSILQRLQN